MFFRTLDKIDIKNRCKKLLEAYKAVYLDLKKQIQFQQSQQKWNQVKDSV